MNSKNAEVIQLRNTPPVGGVLPDNKKAHALRKTSKDNNDPLSGEIINSVWNNRLFLVVIFLLGLAGYLAYSLATVANTAADNVVVKYVKLAPWGETFVSFDDKEKPVDFFETTIDSELQKYARYRYSKNKGAIQQDYGIATLFMGPAELSYFTTEFGTNAKGATDEVIYFKGCQQCYEVAVKNININHLDTIEASSPGLMNNTYTSMLYAVEEHTNSLGNLVDKKPFIVQLHWRFMARERVAKEADLITYNPLGIEILQSNKQYDFTRLSSTQETK